MAIFKKPGTELGDLQREQIAAHEALDTLHEQHAAKCRQRDALKIELSVIADAGDARRADFDKTRDKLAQVVSDLDYIDARITAETRKSEERFRRIAELSVKDNLATLQKDSAAIIEASRQVEADEAKLRASYTELHKLTDGLLARWPGAIAPQGVYLFGGEIETAFAQHLAKVNPQDPLTLPKHRKPALPGPAQSLLSDPRQWPTLTDAIAQGHARALEIARDELVKLSRKPAEAAPAIAPDDPDASLLASSPAPQTVNALDVMAGMKGKSVTLDYRKDRSAP